MICHLGLLWTAILPPRVPRLATRSDGSVSLGEMRGRAALVLLLAGCASPVRDLPADRAPEPGAALVAGTLAVAGTPVQASLYLRSQEGRLIEVRPAHETFLVALSPGTWTIRQIGSFLTSDDLLRFEAVPARARFIGAFQPARDEGGNLKLVVRDRCDEAQRILEERYGPAAPLLEPGLVESSVPPLAEGGGDLVVALQRRPPRTHASMHMGWACGYPYYWYPHYYYRPCPPPRPRSHAGRR